MKHESIYFEILEMTPTLTLTLIERILDFVTTHISESLQDKSEIDTDQANFSLIN